MAQLGVVSRLELQGAALFALFVRKGCVFGPGLEYYRHADWLGSSRLTSTPSRTVSGDVAYAPFGETYAQSGSPDLSFAGQNPNANLYDFMYREYGIQGRWPSPDPLGPGAFNLADPQSLDRYACVRNNPTSLIDPLGLVNLPGYNQLVGAYGNLGCGVQFGASWNEFELLQAAFTPTGQLTIPDSSPDCLATGDCGPATSVPILGNLGLLNLLGVSPGGVSDGPGSLLPSGPQTQKPPSPRTIALSNQTGPGPDPLACSPYLDGTGAGQILFDLCSRVFPNGPWSNCVRGKLLNQYVPNGNPLQLTWYLVADHPYDFATCGVQ